MEVCTNCGRNIGKLETPHIFNEQIICSSCDILLNQKLVKTAGGSIEKRFRRRDAFLLLPVSCLIVFGIFFVGQFHLLFTTPEASLTNEPTYKSRSESGWIKDLDDCDQTTCNAALQAVIAMHFKSKRSDDVLVSMCNKTHETLPLELAYAMAFSEHKEEIPKILESVKQSIENPRSKDSDLIECATIASYLKEQAWPLAPLFYAVSNRPNLNPVVKTEIGDFLSQTPSGKLWDAAEVDDCVGALNAIQTGADIESINPKSGLNPLGSAIFHHSTKAVTFLIEHGAKINKPDMPHPNYKLLDFAKELGFTDIVEIMKKHGAQTFYRNIEDPIITNPPQ